jgi:hypothetical protein
MLSPDHEQSLRRRADRKQGARLYMMLERYLGAARLVSVGITIVPFVPEAFAPPGQVTKMAAFPVLRGRQRDP